MTNNRINDPLGRRLRMALIGGGGNGFIGRVHAIAAQLDSRAELVAGAFSSNPEKSRSAAPTFGIRPERAYGSYRELIETESNLPDNQRIDFVSIATPNFTHFEIAKTALEAGFDVICDKPLTTHLDDAKELAKRVAHSGRVFALTHNYSGYPMLRQARAMVQNGELGPLQAVRTNYIQGFLCGVVPGTVPLRGVWKSDPEKAGSGSLGDIGTHAYHLACYVTGLKATELLSTLKTYHAERPLEDYGHVLIRYGDVSGLVSFSQITHGRVNDITVEVDGNNGSLIWRQEEPNQLELRRFGQPTQIYERNPNAEYTTELVRASCRLPAGHPEGFFEAFANIYRGALDDMVRLRAGESIDSDGSCYPSVHDGVDGLRFVEACQASNSANSSWVEV